MTRGEALKDFFRKTILPVASAALLYCIFCSACVKNGELDYLWLWILCGLPFGIWRLRLWIIPGGGSLGGGIALFLLNFVFAGLIGGCVLVWRLLVAAWYVPLTLYCLLTAGCVCRHGGLKAALWNYGKRPLCRWKSHSPPNGKGQAFPTGRQTAFPQRRPAWPFAHSPTAPTTAAAAKIAFPDRKNHHFMVEWG